MHHPVELTTPFQEWRVDEGRHAYSALEEGKLSTAERIDTAAAGVVHRQSWRLAEDRKVAWNQVGIKPKGEKPTEIL